VGETESEAPLSEVQATHDAVQNKYKAIWLQQLPIDHVSIILHKNHAGYFYKAR